jgi:hypothetical protein
MRRQIREEITEMKTVEQIYARYEATDNAEPSGRLLPDNLNDGQEWLERGMVDGDPVVVCYYFAENELPEDMEDDPSWPELLPWDVDHVAYIREKGDFVAIASRKWNGFPL